MSLAGLCDDAILIYAGLHIFGEQSCIIYAGLHNFGNVDFASFMRFCMVLEGKFA